MDRSAKSNESVPGRRAARWRWPAPNPISCPWQYFSLATGAAVSGRPWTPYQVFLRVSAPSGPSVHRRKNRSPALRSRPLARCDVVTTASRCSSCPPRDGFPAGRTRSLRLSHRARDCHPATDFLRGAPGHCAFPIERAIAAPRRISCEARIRSLRSHRARESHPATDFLRGAHVALARLWCIRMSRRGRPMVS